MPEEISTGTSSFLEGNQQQKADTVAVLEHITNLPARIWDKTTPAVWRTQFLPQLSKRDIQEQAAMSVNQSKSNTSGTHCPYVLRFFLCVS